MMKVCPKEVYLSKKTVWRSKNITNDLKKYKWQDTVGNALTRGRVVTTGGNGGTSDRPGMNTLLPTHCGVCVTEGQAGSLSPHLMAFPGGAPRSPALTRDPGGPGWLLSLSHVLRHDC